MMGVARIFGGEDWVTLARTIATEAHYGQKRKFGVDQGKDYIIHPERVQSCFSDPIFRAVAWLHDVVEDTDVTMKDLQVEGFPPEVLWGVKGMTKVEGESYLDYLLRVKKNEFALPVKCVDIEDNLKSVPDDKKGLREKYEMALYILDGTHIRRTTHIV